MLAPLLADYQGSSQQEHIVCLHGVAWAENERLLAMRGEHSVPR